MTINVKRASKLTMGLSDNFMTALAETSVVATNPYLVHTARLLQRLELEAAADSTLARYVAKLGKRIGKVNFALDSAATNEFLQLLGEAHFYSLALGLGVHLQRVPEAKASRPDFKYSGDGLELFFEVKTLSVVDGELGIQAALEGSLDANLSIEEQLKDGSRIASAVSVVQPFGVNPYKHGRVRGVIQTLIDKARQNVKKQQFKQGQTFLVLDLSLLRLTRVAKNLRPVFWETHPSPAPVTGNLWTTAFGEIGSLVHGVPEFEGRAGIDGKLERLGLLNECDYIKGLLLLSQVFDRDANLSALLRSTEKDDWDHKQLPIGPLIHSLVGNLWNDELDSNGFRLNGDSP